MLGPSTKWLAAATTIALVIISSNSHSVPTTTTVSTPQTTTTTTAGPHSPTTAETRITDPQLALLKQYLDEAENRLRQEIRRNAESLRRLIYVNRIGTMGVQVRLVNGSTPLEGRVEIVINGLVGTVCDDSWDGKDAAVVCRMLGYRGPAEALGNAAFGEGWGLIWFDDVHCIGNEHSLAACRNNGWGAHNCRHHEDAGVRCRDWWNNPGVQTTTPEQPTNSSNLGV